MRQKKHIAKQNKQEAEPTAPPCTLHTGSHKKNKQDGQERRTARQEADSSTLYPVPTADGRKDGQPTEQQTESRTDGKTDSRQQQNRKQQKSRQLHPIPSTSWKQKEEPTAKK